MADLKFVSKIDTPDGTSYDIKDAYKSGVYSVIGTQTAATGTWTGALHGVNALYNGLTIMYYLPWAGSGNTTLNLTLDNGTSTGAVNCYYGNTTRLTTHYSKGSNIIMTYWAAGSIKIDGVATTDNRWIANANFADGDTRTRQSIATGDANRPLLMSYAQTSSTTTNVDNVTYRNNSIYANPSTGEITANGFNGDLNGDAGTVGGHATPASGNAGTTEVVLGNDTRLSNARPSSDVVQTYSSSSRVPISGKGVAAAIGTLDGSITGSAGAGKTLTAFSQTDGVVTATFGNISITKSQISDFPTIPAAANDGQINIKIGSTTAQFTANQSGNKTATISLSAGTTPSTVTKKTVVTGCTKKTVVTGCTFNDVVTGGTTTDIPNISKKTVVTGVTKKTVVTDATFNTVVSSATVANRKLTLTTGVSGTKTTGDSCTVTTGDSVTVGTAISAYTSLSIGASGSCTTGDSVTVTTGDSVTVTAGTAPSLSMTVS